jgi:sRNA-binding protein
MLEWTSRPPAPEAAPATTAQDTAATGAQLAERFPALFGGAPRPIKLRIQHDIQERAPGVFSKQALAAFFRRYTSSTAYLVAVSKARERFDLDGQPAGELSEEHRQIAAEELARRRAKHQARRAQEEQAQRERARLLREYETTKLTEANFCALKGIAPSDLPALLERARAEALSRPPRPERDGKPRRHEPRNDAGRPPHHARRGKHGRGADAGADRPQDARPHKPGGDAS